MYQSIYSMPASYGVIGLIAQLYIANFGTHQSLGPVLPK